MRWLLWMIALAAVAVGLILAARVNEGYVLLVSPQYRIELSINLAVVIAVAIIIAGYLLVRTVALTMSMPGRVRDFQRRRTEKKAKAVFTDLLRNYLEGRFGKAERSAASALALTEFPGLAALLGA